MSVVINFRTDKKIKTEAQALAKKMGLSLSDILDGSLRNFLVTKRFCVDFSNEILRDKTIKDIKEAERDLKNGNMYAFNDTASAVDFIDDIIEKETA
jgi:addiction module RelB/DinJ family antitoxin